MKKIKENWFKIIILILFGVVALGYLWNARINQQKENRLTFVADQKIQASKNTSYFEKKIKCEKYASAIEEKIDGNNSVDSAIGQLLGAFYFQMLFYSPKEDSCLYVAESMGGESGNRYYIYNALTHHKITSFQFPDQFEDYKQFLFDYSDGEIRL